MTIKDILIYLFEATVRSDEVMEGKKRPWNVAAGFFFFLKIFDVQNTFFFKKN